MMNVAAKLLLNERRVLASNAFAEIVIWGVAQALPESRHRFKYRLALVVDGEYVLRFDNEAGKGDHKHVGKKEFSYTFISAESLLGEDIEAFVRARRKTGIDSIVSHTAYLINLGSPDFLKVERSYAALEQELKRSFLLGIPWVVYHPGTHMEEGEKDGIDWDRKNLDYLLDLKSQG